jgi:signal transduction histidine kinase
VQYGGSPIANPARRVIAVAALVIGLSIAQRRGEFRHPSADLLLIAVPAAVLVADSLFVPRTASPWRLAGVSALVLASVSALTVVDPIESDFAAFFYILLCALAAATYPRLLSVPVLVAAVTLPLVLNATSGTHTPVSLLLGVAFAWAVAAGMRSHQRVVDELQTAQQELQQHQAQDERRRIAREVHDLLAHTLSVTMLNLTGARLALEDGQTDEALEALKQAETGGRDAMREVRATVGLLGDGEQPDKALPGAADVPNLVREYKTAGMDVTFDIEGPLDQVPKDMGLAAYRITQESLANAAKHAPEAPVHVQITVCPTSMDISIANIRNGPSPALAGGRGLPGMSERATILGGSLTAGPVGDRWEVHATLPTTSTPTTST